MRYSSIMLYDQEEACRLLAPAQSARTDAQGQWNLADLVKRGAAYQVRDHRGEPVAAYLLQAWNGALWITAAAGGRADDNLVAVMARLVEHQAFDCGFTCVGFRTERRGLVRKAQRLGYQVTRQEGAAYYLRKTIQ